MNDEYLRHQKRLALAVMRQHGVKTPFLLLDENRILFALKYFRTYLPAVRLFYAVKANSSLSVLKLLASEGLSFDVSSAGEIHRMRELGVSSVNLFLSTPIKTPETIEALAEHKVVSCAVDTKAEVERIAAALSSNASKQFPKIFVRIRLATKNVAVDLNTKFGASLSDALGIIERSLELGFPLGGISFHVGSQSTSSDNYVLGLTSARQLADEAFQRLKIRPPILNIGGGFCDSITAKKAGTDLDVFYKSIGDACTLAINDGFEIYAEPGRCLVSDAGAAVSSVVGTTTRNGNHWAYLDDGIYGCYSIKLYENPDFRFYPLYKDELRVLSSESTRTLWTVAGPTCDSLDVIAEGKQLPENIEAGDAFLTPNLGAYSIATASNFNGFSLPNCYLAKSVTINGSLVTSISTGTPDPAIPEIAA